jgi:hypothetical protein
MYFSLCFEAQILNIHYFYTNLNYLSSKVLSLYCVFDVQNLVLCLTHEVLKFLDYKTYVEINVNLRAHMILPLLVKFDQNRPRIDFAIMF